MLVHLESIQERAGRHGPWRSSASESRIELKEKSIQS